MPTSPNDSDPEWAAARTGGLTKREYFAVMAMQGILQAEPHYESMGYSRPDGMLVKEAVSYADELLKALEDK